MKTVLTFFLGAVLAAAIVYYTVGRKPSAPQQVVQSTAPVAQADPSAQPPAAAENETPPPETKAEPERPSPAVREAAPPPRRVEARKPSAMPPVNPRPAQREVAQNRPSAPAGADPVHQQNSTSQTPPAAPPMQQQASTPPPVTSPAPAAAAQNMEARKPEVRIPQTVTIPAGTLVSVRVDQALSSESNDSGDTFRASLDQPLVVDNMVIAERGARVQGRVIEVDKGGRVSGLAHLSLELTSLTTSDGQRVRLQTDSFARQAESSRKRDVAKVGAAAGLGAAIGAIAGGGKGAAIGAAVGGAAGAGGIAATRGSAAEIRPETRVSFRLSQPVTVTEKLKP